MARRLVTIRRISNIRPILYTTGLATVTIDGWTVVVDRDAYRVGDLVVYFELDCFLPASDDRWVHLERNFTKFDDTLGFRVKTTRLNGHTSQGLVEPVEKFPEIQEILTILEQSLGKEEAEMIMVDFMSFEDMLGIKKFDLSATTGAKLSTEFPHFIPKTELDRIQNQPAALRRWTGVIFQESVKMDGASMTAYFVAKTSKYFALLPPIAATGGSVDQPNGRVGICSRKVDLFEVDGNQYWAAAIRNDLPAKLAKLGRSVALQGELCGATIQKNREGFGPGEHDFFLFGIWDIEEQRYISAREVDEKWAPQLELRHVPVMGYFRLGKIAQSIEEILARADGTGINGLKHEGLVYKSVSGGMFYAFKAISNSFLLKDWGVRP